VTPVIHQGDTEDAEVSILSHGRETPPRKKMASKTKAVEDSRNDVISALFG
jgi:hypothetical protein